VCSPYRTDPRRIRRRVKENALRLAARLRQLRDVVRLSTGKGGCYTLRSFAA
jgi:hypothetical protein